jgi:hypothetical protein
LCNILRRVLLQQLVAISASEPLPEDTKDIEIMLISRIELPFEKQQEIFKIAPNIKVNLKASRLCLRAYLIEGTGGSFDILLIFLARKCDY